MSKYWNDIVKNLEPYIPGEQPKDRKYIKLNTNENPYPPSPKVIEAITKAAGDDLRLYPDPECEELRRAIAEYNNLEKDQIFVGNGSDELLAFSFMAFFDRNKPILFPDITYSFYPVYARLFQLNYKLVPLDEEFSLLEKAFHGDNGGIIFPNPNAPTGKYLSLEKIESILKNNIDQVVIVDEAYIDFGGESAVKCIDQYPNLLVIQTFSKSRSLAGLRIGFALGNKDLIEGLNRIKNSINSYTLDRLALAGAVAAMKDEAYFKETRQKVIQTRKQTVDKLKELGFQVIDSKANFIFVRHPLFHGEELFRGLKERGILVRFFNKPRINEFLRVSIGTDDEMDRFVKELSEIIGG